MRSSFSKFRTNIAIRLHRHQTGSHFAGGSSDMTGAMVIGAGTSDQAAGIDDPRAGENVLINPDVTPMADNNDVWKKRFKKRGTKRIVRKVRKLIAYIKALRSKDYSKDEKQRMITTLSMWDPNDLDEYRRQKTDAELYQFHREQAKLLTNTIIELLTNLGFCHHITKGERKFIKGRVRITRVDVSPYAYVFHITRVPFGVKKTDMAQEWVCNEIASTIGKKVRFDLDLYGLRYTVEIGSTMSIPNFVPFKDVDQMSKNLPALSFWAGRSANGAPIYRNLADAPHMIVAGSSGNGKSNMENVIICTLIRRNPDPRTLRFVFFDLKGGVEFSQYAGIPHLWKMDREIPIRFDKGGNPTEYGPWSNDGIVEYPKDVIPALQCLFDECNTRLEKLKKAKVKNIAEYNRGRHPKNKMPFIVVPFDEWATTKKLVGDKAEIILSNIANLSRAVGIHFLLATQYPKAEIINTAISVNFPWRIAFGMTNAASMAVIGSWDASNLSPVGRAILLTSEGQVTVQTPRITNSTVAAMTETARTGGDVSQMAIVDPEEILEWALTNASGRLDRDSLFNQFQSKLTKSALEDLLRSMDNQTFDVQGTLYKITPARGTRPRRMEPVEKLETESDTRKPETTGDRRQATEITTLTGDEPESNTEEE